MSHIKADCTLFKKNDKLVGISLVAQPQFEAERFCSSIPNQLLNGKSAVIVQNGKIIFANPKDGQVLTFFILPDDEIAAHKMLSSSDGLKIVHAGILTAGFKIMPNNQEEDDEEVEVILERLEQ